MCAIAACTLQDNMVAESQTRVAARLQWLLQWLRQAQTRIHWLQYCRKSGSTRGATANQRMDLALTVTSS